MANKVEKSKAVGKKVESKPVKSEKIMKTTKESTPKRVATKTPVKAEATKKVAVKTSKSGAKEPIAMEEERARIYHVTRRQDDGKWQVKFGGSAKPIKLFDTQKEALDYAKQLSASYDRSFSIHKKDGKIRKKKY